jgi:hypothetical protein
MLKTPILIQVYIPNRIGGNMKLLMHALKTQSEWISISKTKSENKMIYKLLSTFLNEAMNHSTGKKKEQLQQSTNNHCNVYLSRTTHN